MTEKTRPSKQGTIYFSLISGQTPRQRVVSELEKAKEAYRALKQEVKWLDKKNEVLTKRVTVLKKQKKKKSYYKRKTKRPIRVRYRNKMYVAMNHEAIEKMLILLAFWGRDNNSKVYRPAVVNDMVIAAGLLGGKRLFVFGTSEMKLGALDKTGEMQKRVRRIWDRYGVATGIMTSVKVDAKRIVYQLTDEGKKRANELEEQLAVLTLLKIKD
jgi:hypothetical protein